MLKQKSCKMDLPSLPSIPMKITSEGLLKLNFVQVPFDSSTELNAFSSKSFKI